MPKGAKSRTSFIGPRLKNGRTRYNRKKVAGTTLPTASKILDSKVDYTLKKQTMYAPSKNLSRSSVGSMLSNIGPFGTRWAGKLKYVDRFNQGNSLGVYSEILFNLNSLFDFDRTNIGHQPFGFDQLAAIYGRYRVLSTSYKIIGTNVEQTQNLTIVAYVDNGIASAGSVSTALEQGYSHFSMRNAFVQPTQFKGNIKLNALTGNSLIAYRADDAYAASVTASPTELLILHIGTEGSVSVNTIFSYIIQVEFECEFWDPKQLPPS